MPVAATGHPTDAPQTLRTSQAMLLIGVYDYCLRSVHEPEDPMIRAVLLLFASDIVTRRLHMGVVRDGRAPGIKGQRRSRSPRQGMLATNEV